MTLDTLDRHWRARTFIDVCPPDELVFKHGKPYAFVDYYGHKADGVAFWHSNPCNALAHFCTGQSWLIIGLTYADFDDDESDE